MICLIWISGQAGNDIKKEFENNREEKPEYDREERLRMTEKGGWC